MGTDGGNQLMISNDTIGSRSMRQTIARSLVCVGVVITLTSCALSDLVNNTDLPADLSDPNVVKTEEGALGVYRQANLSFADAVAGGVVNQGLQDPTSAESFVYIAGLFTDELQRFLQAGAGTVGGSGIALVDLRITPEGGSADITGVYKELQRVRGLTREGVGALRKYNPYAPLALQGHLFAIEGMSEVLLAELYCSGIPLSTVDFEADYTLTAGFSTDDVYTHALALFDSASQYSADSVRILHFINLGRARALLGLGRVDDAAAAVSEVPDTYRYQLSYAINRVKFIPRPNEVIVSNNEGQNGLPFGSHADPRTTLSALTSNTAPLVLASGVEARLIGAEAALMAGRPNWLSLLNALRTTCASTLDCPTPAPVGLGGVAGLPPLEDPALQPLPEGKDAMDVRIDLLFEERAYWLYLTGHRQGDLRRLVRHYHRPESTVYPIGLWGAQFLEVYGSDVTLPVPYQERKENRQYEGCFNRDA